jgi:histidinol phosphatase-like PHP family hydrolase
LDDINLRAAGLVLDMAGLQPTERSQFGYKRAARALIGLPVSVTELASADALRDVDYIGPATARIVLELLEHGRSPTVDAAIDKSGKKSQVLSKRALREGFLSHFAMQQLLGAPLDGELVTKALFRGDFQMHTTGSDGAEDVRGMIEACAALGHTCMGVTDHSYGLPIARGMTMDAVRRQHVEIDRLNEEYAGRFRVFKGIEANILADGSLDLQLDERRTFEFVVASPHSLLRRTEDQTPRVVRAVQGASVAMLGHPRGRIYNSRGGIVADWPRVFAAAAEREVAIELDGNWHRQDVDAALAAQALSAGCIFALDSDAHSIGELRFTDFSIAHARLAGISADRVINCWTDEKLEAWMARVRGTGVRRP